MKSLLSKDSTLRRAKEIRDAVLTVQWHLNFLGPMHIIAAQPQYMGSDFNEAMTQVLIIFFQC